jgi:predicted porin
MQRKILALAVASALAAPAAMAQVTISGQLRFSVDNVRWNDGSAATQVGSGVSKWGVTGHSANIKFSSRESLGGGMTAWGTVEAGVESARTNAQNYAWNGRNSGVGLDTSWGTVMMGLWDSPYKQLDGVWSIGTPAAYSYSATAPIFGNGDSTGTMPNPNCNTNETGAGYIITAVPTTVCNNSAGSATSFQRRLSDTFQYWSPVWSGVQILLGVQTNQEKTNNTVPVGGTIVRADPSLWAAGLRWTGPRWGLVLGHERHKNFNLNAAQTNRDSKDTGTKIGGNYNFGPVQVSLAWERLRYELGTAAAPTDLRHKNTSIGVAVPLGNGAFRGQYSRGTVSGTAAPAAGGNARLANLSYEHNMSKRTMLYIAYAKLSQDAGSARQFGTNISGQNGWQSANLAGSDPRYISFGMNHNF